MNHLRDISVYNHNYYELKKPINGFNLVLEICHEDENYAELFLGNMDGDKFINSGTGFYLQHEELLMDLTSDYLSTLKIEKL